MKNNIKLAFAVIAVLSLGFTSCKKDTKEDTTADADVIIENSAGDAAFNDVAGISDEAYSGSLESYRSSTNEVVMTTCAVITFDTLSSPRMFTVDFGSSNCLCKDGNYRRGKILVSYVGKYRDSLSSHTISFDNYFVNDNQLLGTKTVTNNGHNAAGKLSYTVTVNGKIKWAATGDSSTYTSNRTRVWSQGENTFTWLDDVYLINGTASGVTRNGTSYTMNTATPLKVEIGFRYITDGILEFTPQGKTTRSIDYGYIGGARDALARVTINGNTFTVNLR
jgi:hypothetical protein